MTSLKTEWLGLKLRNPRMVSSSSLTHTAEKLQALRRDVRHLGEMLRGMEGWLEEKEYASVDLRGALSQAEGSAPADFERAQCIRRLVGFE